MFLPNFRGVEELEETGRSLARSGQYFGKPVRMKEERNGARPGHTPDGFGLRARRGVFFQQMRYYLASPSAIIYTLEQAREFLPIHAHATRGSLKIPSLPTSTILFFRKHCIRRPFHHRTVANYIFWMFAANRIKNLGKDFEEVENRFNRFATGRNSSPPRWQFCVRYAKMNWAHAVGALFIKRFYDEESLMRTNSIIDDLMNEFLTLLRDSEWMDKTTRKRAIVKAVGMRRNIGYPDFIDDPVTVDEIYANITMSSEDFMENHLTMIRHHSKLEMLLWDAPVNRSQWATPPTKVNAFYHLEKNQISKILFVFIMMILIYRDD
ncbi:unnamed protein product [Notodromas monacha]|uniref:Peptidase M13 N-terminal domain-containing protein n=1 Tax=Notodromas monacha TaxID=399045 RepID=A0A7R9G9V3_9CRUS|nr:unnamed protein product [Notodromas monacha]CAG0913016.1 unnamed protein product [Notodromas monacha]